MTRLATENLKTFSYNNNDFNGDGWTFINEQVLRSTNILIGEDHFFSEIPDFVKEVYNTTKFDNFYIEVDPYSTALIEHSILEYTPENLNRFNEEFSELFSFYALEEEYKLLKHIVQSGTNLLGSDQIVMYGDRLIFQNLVDKSSNEKAKEIYHYIIEESKTHLDNFYLDPKKPMYFMTTDFSNQLGKLKELSQILTENVINNNQ